MRSAVGAGRGVAVGEGTGVAVALVAGADVGGAALVAAALVVGGGTSIELSTRPPEAHGCVPAAGPSVAVALADAALVVAGAGGVHATIDRSAAVASAEIRRNIHRPSAPSYAAGRRTDPSLVAEAIAGKRTPLGPRSRIRCVGRVREGEVRMPRRSRLVQAPIRSAARPAARRPRSSRSRNRHTVCP